MTQHAFSGMQPSTRTRKAKCYKCINAIARAICVICGQGICKRHTRVHKGLTYCADDLPGYI